MPSSPVIYVQSTAAQEAIERKDMDALKQALRRESASYTLPHTGMSLLHVAVECYGPAVVVLLDHGADPLVQDQDGKTPLDWCNEYPIPRSAEQRLIAAENEHRIQKEAESLRSVLPTASFHVPSLPRARL